MHWLALLTGFALAHAISCQSEAQGAIRRTLGVRFELEEPRWRQHLDQHIDLAEFEQEVTQSLAKSLSRSLGFLDFAPGDTQGLHLVIKISQAAPENLDTQLISTYYDVELAGLSPDMGRRRIQFHFRNPSEYQDPVVQDAFGEEITDRFLSRLQEGSNRRQLVGELLRLVPLSEAVYLYKHPRSSFCLVPFSCHDLHIAVSSRFLIKAQVAGLPFEEEYELTMVPRPTTLPSAPPATYEKGSLLVEKPDQGRSRLNEIEIDGDASELQVKGIHMIEYVPGCTVDIAVTPPSNANF